jgi:hypothetical protein
MYYWLSLLGSEKAVSGRESGERSSKPPAPSHPLQLRPLKEGRAERNNSSRSRRAGRTDAESSSDK